MTEGYIFSLSTFREGVQIPGLRSGGGGYLVSDFRGGVPVSDFQGGTRSQIFRGGTQSQIFGGGGYPVSVKGKNFDTRFGLIHVQTGKKFLSRDTPTPPSKGKKF